MTECCSRSGCAAEVALVVSRALEAALVARTVLEVVLAVRTVSEAALAVRTVLEVALVARRAVSLLEEGALAGTPSCAEEGGWAAAIRPYHHARTAATILRLAHTISHIVTRKLGRHRCVENPGVHCVSLSREYFRVEPTQPCESSLVGIPRAKTTTVDGSLVAAAMRRARAQTSDRQGRGRRLAAQWRRTASRTCHAVQPSRNHHAVQRCRLHRIGRRTCCCAQELFCWPREAQQKEVGRSPPCSRARNDAASPVQRRRVGV